MSAGDGGGDSGEESGADGRDAETGEEQPRPSLSLVAHLYFI